MERTFLSSLLFAASASADSLAAGLSYGIRKSRIPWRANLTIAWISAAGTALSMGFGRTACFFLPQGLTGMLGGLLIALMGAFSLLRSFIGRKKVAEPCPQDALPQLSPGSTLLLGLALTLNNAGLGIGASITGLPVFLTSLCTFFASLLFLPLGNRLGCSRLSGLVGRSAEPLADLLMIALGIGEMLT